MTIWEHLAIALDAIRANPVRAFLTTLGVLIGVLAVILLVGLGDAVRSYVLDTFAGIGSNLIQVRAGKQETRGMQPPSMAVRNRLTMEDADALERRAFTLDGVSSTVLSSGELRSGELRRNVMVLGVGPRYMDIRNMGISRGEMFSQEDMVSRRRVIVVGETIVRELFDPKDNPIGQTVYVATAPFRVVAVTERKGKTFGFDMDDLAFIPTTAAQDLFGLETVSEIIMRAKDRYTVEPAIEEQGVDPLQAHSGDELRYRAIGPIACGTVVVVYVERDEDVFRIISARLATPAEQRLYAKWNERNL